MAAGDHLSPGQFSGLHRGVMLTMTNSDIAEHLDQGGVPALHAEISRRVQTGDKGTSGRHWTSDRVTAEKFSHRFMHGPHSRLENWRTHIPVMMHGDVDPAHVEHDPLEHERQMVGHQGRQEHETLLRQGASAKVTRVEAALPHGDWASSWHEHRDMEDEGQMIRSWTAQPHSWQKLP
jgi:hypothetical protein